jgi:D-amino-acid dehydrogenase
MRVAVVGAGIVGVTSAQALAADGHEVVVFERRSSAATEASFANAGFLAPGYVGPWAAPGLWRKLLGQAFRRDAALRLAGLPGPALLAWLWRAWRSSDAAGYAARRSALLALARDSLARTRALAHQHAIEHEHGQGVLVLLRGLAELAQARAGLDVLDSQGLKHQLLDPAACRRIEPALSDGTALEAGIHLPDAQVGNCRQFALQLKAELQKAGVEFRFDRTVTRLDAARGVDLHWTERPQQGLSGCATARAASPHTQHCERFDAVIVCAAEGAPSLLPALRMPLQPVFGYSVTLPLRHFDGLPDCAPRSGVMDERFKVAITRLGERVRVAGGAELAGQPTRLRAPPLATLYRVLQDWFPGAARQASAQTWKGARPMLADGPPAIGPTTVPGIWANTGHGSSGWALACGSAQLLADLMAGRAPAVDPRPFSALRWQ